MAAIIRYLAAGITWKNGGTDDNYGNAFLSAGAATIPTTSVKSTSIFALVARNTGANDGELYYSNIIEGESFDIISDNPLDNRLVQYHFFNP